MMPDQQEIGRLRSEARATVQGALSDLEEMVYYSFPVPDAKLEVTARILEKLAEELGEAAGMLRRSGLREAAP